MSYAVSRDHVRSARTHMGCKRVVGARFPVTIFEHELDVACNWGRAMPNGKFAMVLLFASACGGCTMGAYVPVNEYDRVPPSEPQEVTTITGDESVFLVWSAPPEPDLFGFTAYISDDDVNYFAFAELPAWQRQLIVDADILPRDLPFGFGNGGTYFFGLSSVDAAGNRSPLTESSTTFDTPRPEGRGLVLHDYFGPRVASSGYDFSRWPYGVPADGRSACADIVFGYENGVPFLYAADPAAVELQDKGRFGFDDPEVGWFFADEWYGTDVVEVVPGHVIMVRILGDALARDCRTSSHVAKVRVVSVGRDAVVLDWAYQEAAGNPELKPAVAGSGEPGPTAENPRRGAEVRS